MSFCIKLVIMSSFSSLYFCVQGVTRHQSRGKLLQVSDWWLYLLLAGATATSRWRSPAAWLSLIVIFCHVHYTSICLLCGHCPWTTHFAELLPQFCFNIASESRTEQQHSHFFMPRSHSNTAHFDRLQQLLHREKATKVSSQHSTLNALSTSKYSSTEW